MRHQPPREAPHPAHALSPATTTTTPGETGLPRARKAAPPVDPVGVLIDEACRTLHLPAIRDGYDEKVRYTTTAALVNELAEAADERQLAKTIGRYGKYDLLCLDEFGYLDLDKAGANLLFQIFTERQERRAIAIVSNAPFSEWKNTFTDARLCAAVVDRATYNGTIIQTGEGSYRLAATQAKLATP